MTDDHDMLGEWVNSECTNCAGTGIDDKTEATCAECKGEGVVWDWTDYA